MAILKKLKHLLALGLSYKLKLTYPMNLPYQYVIEATNKCNFKCAFCPQSNQDHGSTRKQGYLSVEEFERFINSINDNPVGNNNISITLDGEPLMNKSFPEFIRIANRKGMFPRFSSNGRLLTKNLVNSLENNKYLASVDFTADEYLFDTVRGRPGDHKIVLDNMRYLVDKAIKNSDIKVEIADISHFGTNTFNESSKGKLQGLFPANMPSNIKFPKRHFHNFTGHLKSKTTKDVKYVLCPYPWTSFNVTWEGDVVACCRDTSAKTKLGNVFNNTIPEIWWGKEYYELRLALKEKRPMDIEACKDCDMPWSGFEERWNLGYVLSSLLKR